MCATDDEFRFPGRVYASTRHTESSGGPSHEAPTPSTRFEAGQPCMSTGIDYGDLVRRCYTDEKAMKLFADRWWVVAPHLFDDRKRKERSLRVSDSGACRQQLWADVHGKLDIPDNLEMRDSRMEPGIIDGARTACLIAAGVERWHWPYTTRIEQETDADGAVPGHADVIVLAEPDPLEVVECKLTMYDKPTPPPHEEDDRGEDRLYWLYQACRYAMSVGAPSFVIAVHAPAAWKSPKRQQFRYETDVWREKTIAEYERLATALLDERPEPDPRQDFRCKSCRYSQCSENRNRNPLNPLRSPSRVAV